LARHALESSAFVKVAITGAAGYVGSLLVRAHVARGDSVFALARDAAAIEPLPGVTRIGVDLTRPAEVPAMFFENADVVYHCAAEIAREPLMHTVNVAATRALLEQARGRVRHWVQVSSLSVYGRPRVAVITEDTPPQPATTYAKSKLAGDALVTEKSAGAFSHTLARPAGVIGPAMRNRSMVALIDAVARGRFCFIGKPGAIANFIHERNLSEALVLCGTRPEAPARTYNLCQNPTIESMIAAIAAELRKSGTDPDLRSAEIGVCPRFMRIPEGPARFAAKFGRFVPRFPLTTGRVDALTSRIEYPTARIERELGFTHSRSIEDALRALVARYRAQPK
jgi:nucleoside-diphosphate-sugar epimerase